MCTMHGDREWFGCPNVERNHWCFPILSPASSWRRTCLFSSWTSCGRNLAAMCVFSCCRPWTSSLRISVTRPRFVRTILDTCLCTAERWQRVVWRGFCVVFQMSVLTVYLTVLGLPWQSAPYWLRQQKLFSRGWKSKMCLQGWFLVRPLFLDHRWLPSPYALMWSLLRVRRVMVSLPFLLRTPVFLD